jgi:hypothetical protein
VKCIHCGAVARSGCCWPAPPVYAPRPPVRFSNPAAWIAPGPSFSSGFAASPPIPGPSFSFSGPWLESAAERWTREEDERVATLLLEAADGRFWETCQAAAAAARAATMERMKASALRDRIELDWGAAKAEEERRESLKAMPTRVTASGRIVPDPPPGLKNRPKRGYV